MYEIENLCVTKVLGATVVRNPTFTGRRTVCRKAHGLCFCTKGRMVYRQDGREYVSDRRHVLLLPQGASYTADCTEAGEFPIINFQCTEDFAPDGFLRAEIDAPEAYLEEFRELEALCVIKPQGAHLRALLAFYTLFDRLYQALPATGGGGSGLLRPALEYLEAHFTDPALDNRVLAEKAMVSEVYFRRLFRKEFGTSPHKYIRTLRIRKAESLLRSAPVSVTAVAQATGFSGVYHFSRAFKEVTGFTPTAYAARFAEERG